MGASLPGNDLVDALLAPGEVAFAGAAVVVDAPPAADPQRVVAAVERLGAVPCVVVAGPGWPPDGRLHDLLVDVFAATDDELAAIAATVAAAPLAAVGLALHLRGSDRRTVAEGLVCESAVYSALQAGPEHRAWRTAHAGRLPHPGDEGPRVRVERSGGVVAVTLTRTAVRNALDTRMRDELVEALAVAEADPALAVVLRGEGPSFCAGGDLDEFGTAPDPATAHVVRLTRSPAAVLARLAERTTVFVHGACAGSGVELAAFAGRVVADPDATFVLPELTMGLVPGAGGTVSITARCGRHATAWLALTGRPIDAATARTWGLVDEIAVI